MRSVLCLGECLIDFFCTDIGDGLERGMHFEKQAGGAPANVAAGLSKLGCPAYLAAAVGNDPFGRFLVKIMTSHGVNADLIQTSEKLTTMAYVALEADGQRDFVFQRGADAEWKWDSINADVLASCGVLHLGSATAFLDGPLRAAYETALHHATMNNMFISFDPNYRGDLWKGRKEEFVQRVRPFVEQAHWIKVSDEELTLLTGESDMDAALQKMHGMGVSGVAVTLGKKGTLISTRGGSQMVKTPDVKVVDTTGAGDAFVSGFLYQLAQSGQTVQDIREQLSDLATFYQMALFANTVAALTCTKVGAIDALPSLKEVKDLLDLYARGENERC